MPAKTIHLLCSLSLIILAVAPVASTPLATSMRREDTRLEKRVTIASAGIYIGELLERLSRDTGIALSAGADGAADEKVSVFVADIPLADVMNSLYSLMSYRVGEWHWQRTGSAGNYRYRFLQTRRAQLLAAHLDQKLQADFEAHAANMLAAINMPPSELQQYLRGDEVAARLLSGERLRRGLGVFAETLPPDVQLATLRGQASPQTPVTQLSPDGQSFVRYLTEQANTRDILPDGTTRPIPDPTWIRFRLSRIARTIAPMMIIEVEGRGAYGYLGGPPLAESYLKGLFDLWMLPGDSAHHLAEDKKVPRPDESLPIEEADSPLERRLRELSAAVPISVLARLSQASAVDPGSPYDLTVRQFLRKLHESPLNLQHKWRSGILLLNDPSWFKGRSRHPAVSYEAVNELRQAEETQGGFLSLANLASVAARLTEEQLQSLRQEFPVLQHVAYWRPVFLLYNQSPLMGKDLLSPKGLTLNNPLVVKHVSASRFEPFLSSGNASAIRLIEAKKDDAKLPKRIVTIQLLSRNGQVLSNGAFTYEKRPPANVCFNGGFEEVEERQGQLQPKDWTLISSMGNQRFLAESARIGQRAGRLAVDDQTVAGMNWLCKDIVGGTVRIWYQAVRSGVGGQNLSFNVVPMREVGGKLQQATTQNQTGARVRYLVPKEHVGDGRWHHVSLSFDFRSLGVHHAVFAPRINEMVAAVGAGELLLDDIEIKATRK